MNPLNDISDKEFIPFLNSLGIETYNKSFGWILNDPDFGDAMRWLYNNLDQNNALTAREECRYSEMEKKGEILAPLELESAVLKLREEHDGLCLPGDREALEDAKYDINVQTEKLNFLEKQEAVINDLTIQNELIKEELGVEITKLTSAQQQCAQDMNKAADECLALSEEVENVLEDVVDVIANTLTLYGNAQLDKEVSKKYFTFGPFDSYKQFQALFSSHFDLYTSNKFAKQADSITDDDLRSALIEAKSLEERLTDSMSAYIDSKVQLSAEQAKLALVTSYTHIHPSRITLQSMAAHSAIDLLEQEEAILDQQIQNAVKELVESRTQLAVDTTVRSALNIREQIHTDLSHLLETTHQALSLDRLLYCALRHELKMLEEFLQFAFHLKQYINEESDAVASRIELMNKICLEQEYSEKRLLSADVIVDTFFKILGVKSNNDALLLVKLHNDLERSIRELKDNIADDYKRRENGLTVIKQTYQPLYDYVYDGCTKQPNCWDRSAAKLQHSLVQEMERVTKRVKETSDLFSDVKNGDKQRLRKLWQWFLTDPSRLLAEVKGVGFK